MVFSNKIIMPSCVLRYCKNNSRNTNRSKGVTFHSFPRQFHETRERWIRFVQTDRSEEMWLPTDHSTICSVHFKQIDKNTTKAGRVYLKKSAVPCANPTKCYEEERKSDQADSTSLNVSNNSFNPIFDSPRKIDLKHKLQKEIMAKKKLAEKLKKIQRQNYLLNKKCTSYKAIVKKLIEKFGLNSNVEVDLMAKAEFDE